MSAFDSFRFKQFVVAQNQNVHRVGTDGVLLGAWVDVNNASNILDIGTGTGLIALMLAQRSKANIMAIEPDLTAFSIANENIANCPFGDRINIQCSALQDFNADVLFDLIICNPPFFENSLKPPSINRKQQRHTDTLSPTQLIEHSIQLLTSNGRLAVVLPLAEGNRFISIAQSMRLFIHQSCAVFSKESKPQERWLLAFSRVPCTSPTQTKLTILDVTSHWTDEYKELTKEFYLNF